MKNLKGMSLANGASAVVILVVVGVIAVVGVDMMESFEADQSANINNTAANVSLGVLEVTSNLELLGLIIIMGIVIAVLLASFGGFIRGGV